MHHVSVEERLDDGVAEEEPFAPVSLPASAPRQLSAAAGLSGRHSRPLPPPGGARRIQVPVPPPRPEHTLTAGSRPLPPPPPPIPSSQASKNASSPQPQIGLQPTVPISPNSLSSLLPASHWSGVTLTQPRPEPDREKNLYTEAPKKLPQQIGISADLHTKQQHTSSFSSASTTASESSGGVNSQLSSISVIPTSKHNPGKLKNHELPHGNNGKLTENGSGREFFNAEESIFCQRCGKCKCEACVRPRKLPEKWLCGGTLLCSKKTVVDGLSCMFCVRGLFYHCTKDSQRGEIDPEKEPCSCTGNQAAARWGIMIPLLPLIPCLIAYPLWGACAKMTESVYAKCTASGCQCQNLSSSLTSEVTSVNSSSESPSLIAVESQPLPSLLITPEKKQLLSSSASSVLKPKLASLWIHSDTIRYTFIIQILSSTRARLLLTTLLYSGIKSFRKVICHPYIYAWYTQSK